MTVFLMKQKNRKKINENLTGISEIDEYLNSVYAHEDEDFKVFPREMWTVYIKKISMRTRKKV